MNCSDRSIHFSIKNLADCWWQIPPFGKDFQPSSPCKKREVAEDEAFRKYGTGIA
jgi:hypothetical protein